MSAGTFVKAHPLVSKAITPGERARIVALLETESVQNVARLSGRSSAAVQRIKSGTTNRRRDAVVRAAKLGLGLLVQREETLARYDGALSPGARAELDEIRETIELVNRYINYGSAS